MKLILTNGILFVLLSGFYSCSPRVHLREKEIKGIYSFESRKKLMIDSLANWASHLSMEDFKASDDFEGGKYGAYPVMALFETGQVEKARKFTAQQLVGGAAMFREFSTMALYMEYHHLYGKELCQMVKQNQLRSDFFTTENKDGLGGASENHKLMYASAAYLAGIAWPDDYPKKWSQTGYDYLMNWFDTVTSVGFWEEDSPTYLIHHMGPILSVAEHAPEGSEMKKRATMVLDWYFLSIAGEYLHGYWISSAARDYNPLYGLANSAETTALTWLFFGDAPQIPYAHVYQPYRHWKATLHFAVSNYKIPDIIYRIATDRDQAFVHREYMAKNPMQPKEYSYLTPSYGMASTIGENGKIVPDFTRWKVQWVAKKNTQEPSAFFMKHPYGENKWQEWRGASPAEQVMQYKDALLAVYNMEDDQMDFIEGPFCKGSFQAIKTENDWLFLHTGTCLLALKAVNGLNISDEKRGNEIHGIEVDCNVLKSKGRKNGLIVQAAPVENYKAANAEKTLSQFRQDVITKTEMDTTGIDARNPRLRYRSLSGDWLEIEFNNFKKVNGEEIDLENWPLLGNPWMHQEVNGKKLVLEHGGEKRVYDFEKWEVY